MRVILVSRELAPFYGGGIGSYISEMCAVLASSGHEVHVLTGPHDGVLTEAPRLRPGVRFHCADLEGGRAALDAYPTFPMRYSMAVYDTLLRLTPQIRPDYIEFPDYHAEGYFTIRAKRTLGQFQDCVLGVRLHSPAWLCRQADHDARLTLELAHIENMERAAVGEADLVLAAGRRVLERIAGPEAGAAHRPRRAILAAPVDADRLVRDLSSGGPGATIVQAAADLPEVLFFGKLQCLKGPHDFVAAAKLLLEKGVRARFRLIGNDSPTGPFGQSMLEHLRKRAGSHAEQIIFEPARPRSGLAAAIRAATVVCLPSRWESFPMACLEALSLGAPVVASDVGGLAEIIQDGRSGALFPSGDAGAMAGTLERVLGDADLRQRLSEEGPRRVRTLCEPARAIAGLEAEIKKSRAEARGPQRAVSASSAPLRESPLVSIIIPYYNLGQYLPQTLDSLRRQTVRDFEVILIDDGSNDPASIALLDRLGPGIRIVRKPNGGLSSARNRGLQEARARWVLPLDADDLIEPTLLEKALAAAERDPALSYISPLVAYFTDDPTQATGGWVPLGPDRDLLLAQNVGGAASGSLIDRAAAIDAGGYDEWMTSYEDWDFWCRLAERGRRGTVIPEFLLRYRVRADSMFRTIAVERHAALHAYIIARHPDLAANPPRAMRLLASLGAGHDPEASARAIIAENLRYRMADRMNAVLKKTGLQGPLKGAAKKVLRQKPRPG